MSGHFPVIKTNCGPVKGISKVTEVGKVYYSFQNIPYVEQPIGELRFRDPQPIEPWEETLDCTEEGPPPYSIDPMITGTPQVIGDDACLGLNVFTPNLKPWKPLPVMVWIYGGGFTGGNSGSFLYGPDYIVEKDVILVSFNYRVNIFGFLSLKNPKLGIPGNAGLKDQVMALRWVKENISAFGGDANNITLFGESAGGCSVHFHLISPLSEGLFNRAISLSGSAFIPAATATDYDGLVKKLANALELGEYWDEATLYNAICQVEPAKLLWMVAGLAEPDKPFLYGEPANQFVPQVEPYESEMCFWPKSIQELGRNAWSKDIDVIFGGTADEGLMFFYFDTTKQLELINEDLTLLVPLEVFKKINEKEAIEKGKAIKDYFFKDEKIESNKFMHLQSELQFWQPIYRAIMQFQAREGKGKTFVYYLDVQPSKDSPKYYEWLRKLVNIPHMNGCLHSEDLPLLFKTKIAPRIKPTDDIYEVHQVFLNYFINFAKKGKLNNWDALSKGDTKNVKCMNFKNNSWSMTDLPKLDRVQFINSLYDEKDLF